MREINQAGIDLIKSFESCSLVPYQDIKGVWTIGFGHTQDVDSTSARINSEEAEALLYEDLSAAEAIVCQIVDVDLTDNQFAALVSLTFNCGNAPLLGTLGTLLNTSCYSQAADFILKWDHARINGVETVVDGLSRRRQAERTLFLT